MIKKIMPNAFKTTFLAGALILGAASCSRGPLHQLENNKHSILEAVDKYTKSEFNNTDTTDLEKFKTDTVNFSKEDLEDQANFSTKLKTFAKNKNPQVMIKEELEFGYTIGPHMSITGYKDKSGYDWHMEREYADKYIDSTVVVKAQNKVYANEKETKFYIPVEYYGKPDATVVEVE